MCNVHLCVYIQPECGRHANVYIHTILNLCITHFKIIEWLGLEEVLKIMGYILSVTYAISRELHTIELTLEKIPRIVIHTVVSVCALSGHTRSTNSVYI